MTVDGCELCAQAWSLYRRWHWVPNNLPSTSDELRTYVAMLALVGWERPSGCQHSGNPWTRAAKLTGLPTTEQPDRCCARVRECDGMLTREPAGQRHPWLHKNKCTDYLHSPMR